MPASGPPHLRIGAGLRQPGGAPLEHGARVARLLQERQRARQILQQQLHLWQRWTGMSGTNRQADRSSRLFSSQVRVPAFTASRCARDVLECSVLELSVQMAGTRDVINSPSLCVPQSSWRHAVQSRQSVLTCRPGSLQALFVIATRTSTAVTSADLRLAHGEALVVRSPPCRVGQEVNSSLQHHRPRMQRGLYTADSRSVRIETCSSANIVSQATCKGVGVVMKLRLQTWL